MNSSGTGYNTETAGWSNLEQPLSCSGAASANSISSLVNDGCSGSLGDYTITAGALLTTTGGEVQSAFNPLQKCWSNNATLDSNGDGVPDQPWSITLPMIECDGKNPGPCNMVVGAVTVEVIWITDQTDPQFKNIPSYYYDPSTGAQYSCPKSVMQDKDSTGRQICWTNFLNTYKVVDQNGNPFTNASAADAYTHNNIYFKPSCSVHPMGGSGGAVSNVVALYPKLVR